MKINSYINSLHPIVHADMYNGIGDAFFLCVPLLENVLSELGEVKSPYERPLRISDDYKWRGSQPSSQSEEEDEELQARRKIFLPEVPTSFDPPSIPEPFSLTEERLQVIVKIASIELTPDNPSYAGGS